MPRISKPILRRKGRISWFNTLLKAGKVEEATAWARLHKLHLAPQSDPTLYVVLPGSSPVGAVAGIAGLANATSPTPTDAPLPARASTGSVVSHSIQASTTGGAGGSLSGDGPDLDQSGLGVGNLQSIQSAGRGHPQLASVGGGAGAVPPVAVGSAPDGACPASPSGEVEGKRGLCQDNISGSNGWEAEGEGVVGVRCRNRWYVEVQMRNGWAKADVGEWQVQRGDRVRVRLKWVSGDGRDAEYELVEKLVVREEPKQAAPVGLAGQGNAGVGHFEPPAPDVVYKDAEHAKVKTFTFQTVPPQSLGLQQLPVPVVHDQPKEVMFQTTTMEAIVAKERVGVLHVSGKTGPAPAREEFRSPVLDDVPAVRPDDGPAASDYIERIRQEAYAAMMRG